MNKTLVVIKSDNRKTGRMAAIYRGRTSCPSNCPIYKICYANAGPGGSMFNKVEKFGSDDNLVLMKLTCIPPNGALRVNVSGDYFIDDQADLEYIEYLNFFANLRPDVSIISYTHSWRTFTPRNFCICGKCKRGNSARCCFCYKRRMECCTCGRWFVDRKVHKWKKGCPVSSTGSRKCNM